PAVAQHLRDDLGPDAARIAERDGEARRAHLLDVAGASRRTETYVSLRSESRNRRIDPSSTSCWRTRSRRSLNLYSPPSSTVSSRATTNFGWPAIPGISKTTTSFGFLPRNAC